MDEPGRLIFQYRTGRGVWAFVPLVLVPVWIAAAEDQNWGAGVVASVVAVAILTATLWIAIGWSGRTRLAQAWLDGDEIVVQRGNMIDRGEVLRFPLAETRNWRALAERMRYNDVEVAAFDHGGVTYTLQITGAQFADLDTLNGWIEKETGRTPVSESASQAAK